MDEVWIAIGLAGAGTFAMRASFIVAASRMDAVPAWADRVLRQIPPAALAALVLPAVMRAEGSLDLFHPRLAAGVLSALVAWKTRNVVLTLVLGMGSLVLFEAAWPT